MPRIIIILLGASLVVAGDPAGVAKLKELLGDNVVNRAGETIPVEKLAWKVVGLFFSAHWCPPCRAFTPQLVEFYNTHSIEKNFEVVFLSRDRDEASFDEYFDDMPWLAVPFSERNLIQTTMSALRVEGMPTLVLIDGSTGEIVNPDARGDVSKDPEGLSFPWRK